MSLTPQLNLKFGEWFPATETSNLFVEDPQDDDSLDVFNLFPQADLFGNFSSSFYNSPVVSPRHKSTEGAVSRGGTARNIGAVTRKLGPDLISYIEELSKKYQVPKNLFLALIAQESGGNPNAVSRCGARGLCQLMPRTARGLGLKPEDISDPKKNIEAGMRYLSQQLKRFGRVDLALAAYNAGPGAVRQYGGIPPSYAETQKYVRNIMATIEA